VKNRFQNLPFKCNLQRYSEGRRREQDGQAVKNSKNKKSGKIFFQFFVLRRLASGWETPSTEGGCVRVSYNGEERETCGRLYSVRGGGWGGKRVKRRRKGGGFSFCLTRYLID
jgi:hypothetical protein